MALVLAQDQTRDLASAMAQDPTWALAWATDLALVRPRYPARESTWALARGPAQDSYRALAQATDLASTMVQGPAQDLTRAMARAMDPALARATPATHTQTQASHHLSIQM